MTTCTITDISWARVHLTLNATVSGVPDGSDVQFRLVNEKSSFSLRTTAEDGGAYRVDMNITTFSERSPIPDGTWRFVPYVDEQPGPAARCGPSVLQRLDAVSRTFLYARNRGAYLVLFRINDDDADPHLLMKSFDMVRATSRNGSSTDEAAGAADSEEEAAEARAGGRFLSRDLRVRVANWWYRLARRLNPPPGNRILFAAEQRPSMEGNLARVHERMVERGLAKRFAFRYSFRTPHTSTTLGALRAIYLLATSDIVLIDDYFGLLGPLRVSPKTKIVQLWHAGSGFKSIGYSRFGNYASPTLENAHRKYTYAITGSRHLVPVYAEAFGIEESAVIPTGLPRIDWFLDPARTEKSIAAFHARHPDLRGKRVILFAPTFRGRGIKDAYYDYSRLDFARLAEVCGDESVVLFRMHPFIRQAIPIPAEYGDRLRDAASFGDTNDLLHVTDVLITDYSSIIYEFALLERPMLFFAYDKETYAATRGFHRDFDLTAPGKVCRPRRALAACGSRHQTWKTSAWRRTDWSIPPRRSRDRPLIPGGRWLGGAAQSPRPRRTPTAAGGGTAVPATRRGPGGGTVNVAVIFAGGIGARMNSRAVPKQFLEIHGKPVIIHTLEHFEEHPDIDAIAIAIVPDYRDHLARLLHRYELAKVRWVVDGGETGQLSRHRALQAVAVDCPADTIVLIHDGVRPLIDPDLITRKNASVVANGSCITCC
jgi:CDP-ribitol ribitolphosphotransferase